MSYDANETGQNGQTQKEAAPWRSRVTFGRAVDSLPSNSEAKISGCALSKQMCAAHKFTADPFEILQAIAAAKQWYLHRRASWRKRKGPDHNEASEPPAKQQKPQHERFA